jgi:hypothetical protein
MPKAIYDPEAVMRDYYAHVPLSEIQKRHGISGKTIYDIRDRFLEQEPKRWKFQCEHCPRRFESRAGLATHVTKIHRELPPACGRCGTLLTNDNWYARKYAIRVCKACETSRHAQKAKLERTMMIEAYGGKCICCGETIPEFLTIDHINNDGAKQRKEIRPNKVRNGGGGSGVEFYRWLRKHGYPQDNYQLLCFNCNCAKGYFGQCPHMSNLGKG